MCNFITKQVVHISILKLLPCAICHAIKSKKPMSTISIKLRIQLGTRALFGCSRAPTTSGGAQIIGGGAGLRPNLTPAG